MSQSLCIICSTEVFHKMPVNDKATLDVFV